MLLFAIKIFRLSLKPPIHFQLGFTSNFNFFILTSKEFFLSYSNASLAMIKNKICRFQNAIESTWWAF